MVINMCKINEETLVAYVLKTEFIRSEFSDCNIVVERECVQNDFFFSLLVMSNRDTQQATV